MPHLINERIKALIDALKVTPNAFAQLISMPRPDKMYNIVNGSSKASTQILELITSNINSLSAEWLLRGEGEMFKRPVDPSKDIEEIYNHPYVHTLSEEYDSYKKFAEQKIRRQEEQIKLLRKGRNGGENDAGPI